MLTLIINILKAVLYWANNPTSYDGKLLKEYRKQFNN